MLKPRRRRTKEEARSEILGAAAKRLLDSGPDALRIADVAADVGMTHPTLLHHVGSRDQLVQDATLHLMQRTAARTLEAMQRAGDERDLDAFVRESLEAFRDEGRSRAIAWSALTGRLDATPKPPWQPFIAAAQSARTRRAAATAKSPTAVGTRGVTEPGEARSSDDDLETRNALVLAFLAVFALDLIGETVLADAGLGKGPAATDRFVRWFARLMQRTLT